MSLVLDGAHLTVRELVRAARDESSVTLAPNAEDAIRRGAQTFASHAAAGHAIYGWTTGVGALEDQPLAPSDVPTFQRNLLFSHAAGVGAPMRADCVRAMLVARANVLAKGRSGVELEVVRALLALVERGVRPYVPEIGSVGASDLAALAHAALLLIGEGWALADDGTRIPGRAALANAGLLPIALAGRDAFALINGTSQTLGTGALAVADAGRLLRAGEVAAAMSMVGFASRSDFLDARLFADGGRPAVVAGVATRLRDLAGDVSGPAGALREPLASRFAPEVFGAAWSSVEHAERAIDDDLNACIDNPSLLPDGSLANNVGAMGAQIVAEALDAATTSLASVAAMSERRTARLLDPLRNGGLPAFLVHPRVKAGLCSGLMVAQYTAAAVVAELRAHGVAASTQSIPVSNGTEDYGSLSALAARRAMTAVALAESVVAIELLAAAQAIDIRGAALTPALRASFDALRARVPTLFDDRLLADDIAAAVSVVQAG